MHDDLMIKFLLHECRLLLLAIKNFEGEFWSMRKALSSATAKKSWVLFGTEAKKEKIMKKEGIWRQAFPPLQDLAGSPGSTILP